ncbi:FAD/NAD(P)-binding protein [Pseudoxanthomonas daejeonensis]|uniref:Pyridine nucleotide-disulfide oxidoreductase n=1 Tax=Pseudoxanthomonas daejeonensis TaxID=266062 RepID=A0ABQ6Z6V4_9GAMM|nr:FAD/NAD(P)-binding protein [Pseudoxanthomonas daejeonensis]KAF1694442.1 pyridine nucleotide-disulfide oxidoreductase [Pseudoxanthomonas daejeonensis]
MQSRFDIAIIGGGAAGTLAAIQCLRQAREPVRIALFEPAPRLAEGVAYATDRPEHLLNVPTGRMSALPGSPADFLDWLALRDGHRDTAREALARSYAPRREYAHYLRDRLEQARAGSVATLDVVPLRIDALARDDDDWRLSWNDGQARARRVLLAVGNAPRPLPLRGSGALTRPRLVDAWDYAGVAAIGPEADVCIVGTGLSMVDAVLTLEANGHRGRIHLLSRHALLPLAHEPVHEVDDQLDVDGLKVLGVRGRLRQLRRQARDAAARGLPWQAVMERLRPHVQALWRSMPTIEQRRFLRHAVRHWDIHRHRIAPAVRDVLQDLRDSGRLHVHRARLDMATAGQRCVQLTARTHDQRILALDVDHVVNATGVEMRVQAMRSALLVQLLGDGLAGPGAHGIGVATDASGRLVDASGHAQDALRVIGSLRIGEAWESIAVPELRVQAEAIACDWFGDGAHASP